jgi:von Willebrand factor type A domain
MTLPVRGGAPLIAVLVDRSGSMAQSLAQMEDGLNDFIRDQVSLPGEAGVMLAQFDDRYETVWQMQPLRYAPQYHLKPRGGTALYDGIGRIIADVNEQLAQEDEHRPVVVVIVTDGHENGSKEWTLESVKSWIKYQMDVYQWQFIFLGANLDAVNLAGKFGIPAQAALTYDTRRGKTAYQLLSKQVGEVRRGNQAGFSDSDRRKAIGR